MVEAGKHTGSVFYFKPLRDVLNDTFGAMTNVAPEAVFSSRKGFEDNPNSLDIDDDESNESGATSTKPSTSTSDGDGSSPKSEKDKKQSKCNLNIIY